MKVNDLTLRERANLPVTVYPHCVMIGNEEFPYPITEDGVTVKPDGRFNLLTLTLLVGEVTYQTKPPQL